MTLQQANNSSHDQERTGEPVVSQGAKEGGIKKWAFRVNRGENKLVGALRGWFRIFFIMVHEFSETAILIRASALTYSIVLSMVPILAMSTAVLKGLGSANELKTAAYRLIDQLEPEQLQEQQPTPEKLPATIKEGEENPGKVAAEPDKDVMPPQIEGNTVKPASSGGQSMTSHLRNAVDTIFAYVDRTNFAALGAFGIVGLLLAVVLLLSTIENAMNVIWHTKQGRSLFRKIMDYLALLILLPISINLALAGDTVLESPKMLSYLHTFMPSAWTVKMLLKILPFLFVILTLMVMYQFFPNVRVKSHAAFAGALFAGFFWFMVQRLYLTLQIGVANYNAIYGSFATVPLFLIWIQLGWTFILLGATLAYAVQNRHQYYLPGAQSSPQRNLQLAFDILNTIYDNFAHKKPTSLDDLALANEGDHPGDIQDILKRLVNGGLLHRTEDNGTGYIPVTSAENIEAREVVQLILGHEKIPTVGGQFSREVIKAAEAAIPKDAFPVVPPSSTNDIPLPVKETNDEKTL